MKEHAQPSFPATNVTGPDVAAKTNRFCGECPALSDSFARVAPLIMGQPGAVDLSEMLLRLRRQEL